MAIKAGGLMGGITGDSGFTDNHSDNLQGLEKLPQANGGVPAKVTTHMPGNNTEGPVGGINNKG